MNLETYYRSGYKYLLSESGRNEVKELFYWKLYSEKEEDFQWAIYRLESILQGLPHIIYNTSIPERLKVYENLDTIRRFGLEFLKDNLSHIAKRYLKLKNFEARRDVIVLLTKYLPEATWELSDFLYLFGILFHTFRKLQYKEVLESEEEKRLFRLCCRASLRYGIDGFVERTFLSKPYQMELLKRERESGKYSVYGKYQKLVANTIKKTDDFSLDLVPVLLSDRLSSELKGRKKTLESYSEDKLKNWLEDKLWFLDKEIKLEIVKEVERKMNVLRKEEIIEGIPVKLSGLTYKKTEKL